MFGAVEPYILAPVASGQGRAEWRYWLATREIQFPKALHMATCNTYDQMQLVTIPNLIEVFWNDGADYTHQKSIRRFLVNQTGSGQGHLPLDGEL